MRIALMALCAALVVPVFAEDTAKPRDTKKPAQTEQTDRHRPQRNRPHASRPTDRRRNHSGTAPAPDQNIEPRRPKSESLPKANIRHPRPSPEHLWRQENWRWRHWQYDWWPQYRNERHWFPFRYPRISLYFELHLFGQRFGPHFRIWHTERQLWFYWPFSDPPEPGCSQYWVPTRRTAVYDPEYGWRWQYWRWRWLYFCID